MYDARGIGSKGSPSAWIVLQVVDLDSLSVLTATEVERRLQGRREIAAGRNEEKRQAEAVRLAKEAEQKALAREIDKNRVLADLKSKDVKLRKAALRDIGILGDRTKEASADLVALLDDNLSRSQAAKALAGIGKAAVPDLLKGLRAGNFFVRQYCAQILGQIGPDASAAGAILRSLAANDPSAAVREAAGDAAKKVSPK